jgi:hypothetical protein
MPPKTTFQLMNIVISWGNWTLWERKRLNISICRRWASTRVGPRFSEAGLRKIRRRCSEAGLGGSRRRCSEAGLGGSRRRCSEAGLGEIRRRCSEAGLREIRRRCSEAGLREIPRRCSEAGLGEKGPGPRRNEATLEKIHPGIWSKEDALG